MTYRISLAAPLALGALLVAGCAGDGGPAGPADDPSSESPDAGADGGDPGRGGQRPGLGDPTTCELVRAGIDAFNTGDFDETVEQFTTAVSPAEDAAAADDSRASRELLDAVRYYAELAPDDYPEAASGSRDFLRYKQITLLQCASGGTEQGDRDPPGVFT